MPSDLCSIDGCFNSPEARGWCAKHYKRWWKTGDPLVTKITPRGEGREWILNLMIDGDRSVCWEWPFGRDNNGYGRVEHKDGSKAHVLALILDGRPKMPGFEACHSCDNKPCVNPAHLNWCSRGQNVADAWARGQRLPSRNVRSAIPSSVRDRIRAEHSSGLLLQEIADGLTTDGVPTARGGPVWQKSTVCWLLKKGT